MNKQLFPPEFLHSSIEYHTFSIRNRSIGIYLTIIVTLTSALAVSPFVYVDVFINASGIITPSENRYNIYAPITGKVLATFLKENKEVNRYDTLLILDNSLIFGEIARLNDQLSMKRGYLEDAKSLLMDPFIKESSLKTSRYRLEQMKFLSSYDKLLEKVKNAEKNFSRQVQLYDARIISEKEFELNELNYSQVKKELEIDIRQQKATWQHNIIGFQHELFTLNRELNQLSKDLEKYVILSPVDGILQNVMNTEAGQYIQQGNRLTEISPQTALIATCWVPPSDIGLLKVGQTGRFRIDAFNSAEWGVINGTIQEISGDAYLTENKQPAFIIKCELEKKYLSIKNGFRGYLIKGMTIQSSFIITRRSVYQLIFDRADDWLNPQKIKSVR